MVEEWAGAYQGAQVKLGGYAVTILIMMKIKGITDNSSLMLCVHSRMHARTHTHMRTRILTHTHTHACPVTWQQGMSTIFGKLFIISDIKCVLEGGMEHWIHGTSF